MPRCTGLALVLALAGCARGDRESITDGPTDPPLDVASDSNGCAVQPCSILPQCGCTGNTTCDVDSSDYQGTACRTINLEGDETATCTNSMECDRGYICLGDTAFSSCKKYCSTDGDCGTPRGQCIYTVTDGSGQPISDTPQVCSSNCDPLDAATPLCPSGYKCTLFTLTTMEQVVDCSPAGAGTQGTACTDENDCSRGFQCVQFGANPFKCARICDTASPVCPSSTSCIGFGTPYMVGGTTYGVCGP